ncbi:MAG: hypothetical protein OXT68_01850, partial [Chloroflexota bacterium]|nr:hypothetical protein [Chloroflexota bacterium]
KPQVAAATGDQIGRPYKACPLLVIQCAFSTPSPGPLPRINGEGEARKENIHKIECIACKKEGCRGVSLKRPLEISPILAKRSSIGQALQDSL